MGSTFKYISKENKKQFDKISPKHKNTSNRAHKARSENLFKNNKAIKQDSRDALAIKLLYEIHVYNFIYMVLFRGLTIAWAECVD